MSIHSKALVLFCAVWCLGAASSARAALLVAPERIPGDSFVVISAPDTAAAFGAFKQTPLFPAIEKLAALPAIREDSGYKKYLANREKAEKDLGLPLDPEGFCTQVLAGFDLALTLRPGTEQSDLLLIVKFKDLKVADQILEAIEKEAARGAGAGAAGAVRQTIAGESVLVAPAEGLWACKKGDLLIATSSADMMQRALSPKGGGYTTMPAVAKGLAAIGNPASAHLFFSIDYVQLLRVTSASDPALAAKIGRLESLVADAQYVGVADIDAKHISLKVLNPAGAGDATSAGMAKSFAPTEIGLRKMVPSTAMLAFTLNYFDTKTILRLLAKSLDEAEKNQPGQPSAEEQINKALAQYDKMLGFKLKDDLLDALGPELGVCLDNIQMALGGGGGMPFQVDLAVGVQVRDAAKIDATLQKLEPLLTTLVAARLGAGSATDGSGDAAGAAGVQMRPIERGTAKGKVLVLPKQPALSPGWIRTGDILILGTNEKAIVKAAQGLQGEATPYISGPEYMSAKALLPAKANTESFLSVRPVVQFASGLLMMFGGVNMEPNEVAIFNSMMDILKTVNQAFFTTAFTQDGDVVVQAVMVF